VRNVAIRIVAILTTRNAITITIPVTIGWYADARLRAFEACATIERSWNACTTITFLIEEFLVVKLLTAAST